MRLKNVDLIVIHCSAGNGLIPSMENYWYNTLKWKSPGYHIIIYPNGTKYYIGKDKKYHLSSDKFDPNQITNGVAGFNTRSLNVCYVGGVIKSGTKWIAVDTRTEPQKVSLYETITFLLSLLKTAKNGLNNIKILGHRDLSPDKNGNGVIEPWERIKECPSFDAIDEYFWLVYSNENRSDELPT